MDSNEIICRLKKVFDALLNPKLRDISSFYFDKLLTHLTTKENEYLLQESFTSDWVDKCVTIIDEDLNKIHPKVIPFLLNFASRLLLIEWNLVKFKERRIADRIFSFAHRYEECMNPSIKLGYIHMISSVSHYSLGLEYLRQTGTWKLLLQYAIKDRTIYVVHEASRVLYELLYKYSTKMKDNAFVLQILEEIMKPIQASLYNTEANVIIINVDNFELLHGISPTLDLLTTLLEQTLESSDRCNISLLLEEHYNFKMSMWRLIEMTHNSYFVAKIYNTISAYNFANMVYEKLFKKEPMTNFNEFGMLFFNVIRCCVARNDIFNFIKVIEINHKLWRKLGTRVPREIEMQDQPVVFENQLIFFHILPVLFSLKQAAPIEQNELFESYLTKLLDISYEHTIRIGYNLRDACFGLDGKLDSNFTADLAHKCIQSLISLEHILTRNQAVLVTQALLKALVLITGREGMVREQSGLIIENPRVIHSIMVGIRKLVDRHKITWTESVEVICIVNCVIHVLENHNIDTQCSVEALKLLQLAIERFLSPNMALLVDNLQGSGLVNLGPVINQRLHDPAWEIRDSTLELTTTISDISHIKYPAFQSFLANNNVAPIVYDMAKHDGEIYVRASAFKCIAKMIPIEAIWNSQLRSDELWDYLLHVIYAEAEDVVRIAALCTLQALLSRRKMPPQYKRLFFSTLCFCIVGYQHWEIKLQAFQIWRIVFVRNFESQGMIDGEFPSVTFSSEHKKIMTLTHKEVVLRVAKVFAEVQKYGYFGVKLKCLEEEHSIEVVDFIVNSVQFMYHKLSQVDLDELVKIVDDIEDIKKPEPEPELAQNPLINAVKSELKREEPSSQENEEMEIDGVAAENVMETILSLKDIKLIENNYIQPNSADTLVPIKRHIDENFCENFALHIRDYLKALKKYDIENFVEKHRQSCSYKDTLVSLLDDIIYIAHCDDETVFADCY